MEPRYTDARIPSAMCSGYLAVQPNLFISFVAGLCECGSWNVDAPGTVHVVGGCEFSVAIVFKLPDPILLQKYEFQHFVVLKSF
jgi:hypothetical protein